MATAATAPDREPTTASRFFQPTPEQALLLMCARQHMNDSEIGAVKQLLSQAVLDWDVVIHDARWHKLSGFLYVHLSREPFSEFVPAETMATLKGDFARNTARFLYYRAELTALLKLLHDASVPVIVLKGAALQGTIYSSPGVRPMADIDLLVPEDELHRAYELVRSTGYHPAEDEAANPEHWALHQHLPVLVGTEKAALIEVHRHVVRKDSALAFDIGGFWSRAVPFDVNGTPARILSPEDFLQHLAVNFFRDRRFYSIAAISQLADIAEFCRYHTNVRPIDWQAMAARARHDGVDGPVACAMTLAARLLNAPIPEESLRLFWQGPIPDEKLAAFATERVVTSNEWSTTDLVPATRRYGYRSLVRSVWNRLFPSRSHMMYRYGSAGAKSYIYHVGKRLPVLARFLIRPWSIGDQLNVDKWMHSLYRKQPTTADITDD